MKQWLTLRLEVLLLFVVIVINLTVNTTAPDLSILYQYATFAKIVKNTSGSSFRVKLIEKNSQNLQGKISLHHSFTGKGVFSCG